MRSVTNYALHSTAPYALFLTRARLNAEQDAPRYRTSRGLVRSICRRAAMIERTGRTASREEWATRRRFLLSARAMFSVARSLNEAR